MNEWQLSEETERKIREAHERWAAAMELKNQIDIRRNEERDHVWHKHLKEVNWINRIFASCLVAMSLFAIVKLASL